MQTDCVCVASLDWSPAALTDVTSEILTMRGVLVQCSPSGIMALPVAG